MKAKVMVAGHALHAQLIVFPLGLLGISVLWDILRLSSDNPMWAHVAFWTIAAGVVSALVAAIPGFHRLPDDPQRDPGQVRGHAGT